MQTAAAAAAAPAPQQPKTSAVMQQTVPMAVQNQYFSGWNPYNAQTVMFTPSSPFYPGASYMNHHKRCKKKKKKKKKKKHSDSESDDEEYFYMRAPMAPAPAPSQSRCLSVVISGHRSRVVTVMKFNNMRSNFRSVLYLILSLKQDRPTKICCCC